jgi:hypothetical protein
VGYETLFRLEYDTHLWGLWERTAKVTNREPGNRHRDGDGRVPVASAALENVETRYVRGIHGGLPNIPDVYEDVFRWLAGRNPTLPDSPEGVLSQHLAANETTSQAPALDGSDKAAPFSDDPGLWNLQAPDTERLRQLEADLDAGNLPEFQRLHWL